MELNYNPKRSINYLKREIYPIRNGYRVNVGKRMKEIIVEKKIIKNKTGRELEDLIRH